MSLGFNNAGAVWDPIRRVWTTATELAAGGPQQVMQGMGEGFANDLFQDNFGRTFTETQNYTGGEGAVSYQQTETANQIFGEGTPMIGDQTPITEMQEAMRLGDMMPKDFYTGNLSANTLDYMVPHGSEWGRAMALAGAPVASFEGRDIYNQNADQNFNEYFSTFAGDYRGQEAGKDNQMFGFYDPSKSFWGADTDMVRDWMINKIAPQLGASYEDVVSAMDAAYKEAGGNDKVGGYDYYTSPLDIINTAAGKLAAAKGMTPQPLFDEPTLTQSRQQAQERGDMMRKLSGADDPWYSTIMEGIQSPGFGMLMGFGLPMISAWSSAMSGASQLGSGLSASANTSGAFNAPFATTTAGQGLSFSNLGASAAGQGLLVPAGSTALVGGLNFATPTTAAIGESGVALGADAFAPMADSTVWAPMDTSLMGDYQFGGEGFKLTGGQGLDMPSYGNLASMGGGQGLTGFDALTGNTIGEAGVVNQTGMLDSVMPFNSPGAGWLDQAMQQLGNTPDWLDQAMKFGGDALMGGFEGAPTLNDMGYVPEDDSGGLGLEDAIFRSNKQRKGVPGSGFNTFNVGAPGLFIP